MGLLGVLLMTMAASEVSLTVEASTPCLGQEALGGALRARGLSLTSSVTALVVHVGPAPGGLEVSGRRRARLRPAPGGDEREAPHQGRSWQHRVRRQSA